MSTVCSFFFSIIFPPCFCDTTDANVAEATFKVFGKS